MVEKISKEITERVDKLRSAIERHSRLYHVLDKPEITDEAYDSLVRELLELEEKYPELKSENSPTERVGGEPLKEFKKVRHEEKQWSFDDCFDFEGLKKWDKKVRRMIDKESSLRDLKIEYCCELKIDGLKMVLTYENGNLVTGATRGDGQVGEDVTLNLKTIKSIPLKIPVKEKMIVVGECWLSKKELLKINAERKKAGEELYANTRNVAAGFDPPA